MRILNLYRKMSITSVHDVTVNLNMMVIFTPWSEPGAYLMSSVKSTPYPCIYRIAIRLTLLFRSACSNCRTTIYLPSPKRRFPCTRDSPPIYIYYCVFRLHFYLFGIARDASKIVSFVFLLRRHKIIGNRMRRLAIVEFMIMIFRFNFFLRQ